MNHLLRIVMATAVLALVSSVGMAQEKKPTDPKKEPPKTAKPADTKPKTTKPADGDKASTKKSALGKIEIYESKDGGFRFRIKDADDKVVAMPPKSFETKEDVEKLLEMLKATLEQTKPTFVK